MTKKVLISRLGAGSITVALIAALPGCNLALTPNDCVGRPSSRGMSSVDCPDAAGDATVDTAGAEAGAAIGDAAKDEGAGDRP
jgi:hypothetical protein